VIEGLDQMFPDLFGPAFRVAYRLFVLLGSANDARR
jgi:hypothetical protein